MRKRMYLLMVVMMICLSACNTKSDDNKKKSAKTSNPEELMSFKEEKIEIPCQWYSSELDRITEQSLGLQMSPSGDVELFVLRRQVKDQYVKEAEEYKKNEKTFEINWYDFHLWKYVLQHDNTWQEEEVVKGAVVEEQNQNFWNTKAWYDEEDLYFLEAGIGMEDKKLHNKLMCLSKDSKEGWKTIWEKTEDYTDDQETDSAAIASTAIVTEKNQLLITKADTKSDLYSISSGELLKEDVCPDTSLAGTLEQGGMIYGLDVANHKIMVYSDDKIEKEKEFKLGQIDDQNSIRMSIGNEGEIYLLNKEGLFRAKEDDKEFTKILNTRGMNNLYLPSKQFAEFEMKDDSCFYVIYAIENKNSELGYDIELYRYQNTK